MKLRTIRLGVVSLMFSAFCASASIFYVNVGNPAPASPFTTWATAATNIQDAIDAAGTGDMVLVTNGIYAFGGRVMAGDLTNRVALTNALTVQSVNGPWVTTIQGAGATNGTAAVRCAWLTNGASLIGFTLIAGATRTSGDTTTLLDGGGVWCASSNALVSNCMIVSNTALSSGGGAYQGMLKNSLISSNGTVFGGGGATYKSVLVNCTIVSNANYGVVSPLAMTNCIIYYNNNFGNYNGSGSANSHCCTTPSLSGTGNFTTPPQLFADGIHLSSSSPCIGAGVNVVTGTDIFGMSWSNPPSVGCAEWQPSPLVSTPQIKLTGDPVGFSIGNLMVGGASPFTFSWFKDGSPLQDNGHFSSTQTSNLVATGVSVADAGSYQVVVSNAFGVITSGVAQLVVHCVDVAGANPVAPYSSWATAATNIQDAITASAAGDIVLVMNGLYASGGKSMDGLITNRISVDRPIIVQSENGPDATIIQGAWDPATTNGPGAIRCAWLTNGATLSGFTLRGGATRASALSTTALNGGGVWGAASNGPMAATVFHCIIKNNASYSTGGGAYQVVLNNCFITANSAIGTGSSNGRGGGAGNCTLKNCALTGNYAYLDGSGASSGFLVNCTIAGNSSAGYVVGGSGAGVYGAWLTNCIAWGNFANLISLTNYAKCRMFYCCTYPPTPDIGNMGADPQLLPDNVHLAATSPCLGKGTNNVVSGTDIDGQPWKNPPSIGCDEWQPAPVISAPLTYQINTPAHGLTFTVIVAGQSPFTYSWSKDGLPVQDDGHYGNSGTANLVVNNFGPADAGVYQVIATNASGTATSQVAQVVIHAVDVAGSNPVAPYAAWTTAATNVQDAINAASAGDIVLVTNGIYGTGGKVMSGNLTNRVALDRAVTVMSVSGYASTIIQGAWDPASTNGPGAVRCAYVGDGAVLIGFTLQNGATRATGDSGAGGPLESGGGVWCNSTNGVVANCVLSNNSAIYGGGIINGMLNNSYVTINTAFGYGGGAYYASLKNCTVVYNSVNAPNPAAMFGAGTYNGATWNSIVFYNNDNVPFYGTVGDNYYPVASQYHFSCTSPTISGSGNINAYPQFPDSLHLATTSPCRGTGSALYTGGTDLDGEPWVNPPSMGCEEVVVSNLVGPLSVNIISYHTNVLVNHYGGFAGFYTGHAFGSEWFFGDGQTLTNVGPFNHLWTNLGDYVVTYTVYNNDYPAGISASNVMHVQPLNAPQMQQPVASTNGFQFQFPGQWGAVYTIQYATNIVPPVSWKTLLIRTSTGGVMQVADTAVTNSQRFYRVSAQ